MDPNEALRKLRRLSKQIDQEEKLERVAQLAEEMCWVFDGLDEWLMAGGVPPTDWARAARTVRQSQTRR